MRRASRRIEPQRCAMPVSPQRTFREIMFLQELANHENIIRHGPRGRAGRRLAAALLRLGAAVGLHADPLPTLWVAARRLLNVLKAENDRDIYLVFEYMETDLHAVVRANILEEIHKQYIMYQLFRSLKYMHSAQLLHRDIKVPAAPAPAPRRCRACAPRSCGLASDASSHAAPACRSRATCCSTASARSSWPTLGWRAAWHRSRAAPTTVALTRC